MLAINLLELFGHRLHIWHFFHDLVQLSFLKQGLGGGEHRSKYMCLTRTLLVLMHVLDLWWYNVVAFALNAVELC
jgi:hypothetical protein